MKYLQLAVFGLLAVFTSTAASSMEFKCYWKFGVRSDMVTNTMDKSKLKSTELRGDGGYQIVSSDHFESIPGSKKMKLADANPFGYQGIANGELFTNGNLNLTVSTGPYKGQIMGKYRCEKTSKDVIAYLNEKSAANENSSDSETILGEKEAQFDTRCRFKFTSAEVNVTPDKCILSMEDVSYGNNFISLRRNGKTISWNECIKKSDMASSGRTLDDFLAAERTKFFNPDGNPAEILMLLNDQGKYFDGVGYSTLQPGKADDLPRLKKNWNKVATGKSANGNVGFELIPERGLLNLRIEYVDAVFKGSCKPYDPTYYGLKDFMVSPEPNIQKSTSTSATTPTTSSSKLEKAKSTCTELGFTLGTEKHGDCVLKMMDN